MKMGAKFENRSLPRRTPFLPRLLRCWVQSNQHGKHVHVRLTRDITLADTFQTAKVHGPRSHFQRRYIPDRHHPKIKQNYKNRTERELHLEPEFPGSGLTSDAG